MAKKVGNGGHGYENYDQETGKYIAMDKLSDFHGDEVKKNVSDWGETEIELFKRKMAQRREARNSFTNRKSPQKMSPVEVIKEINELRPNVEKSFMISKSFENDCKDKRQLLAIYRSLSQNLKNFPDVADNRINLGYDPTKGGYHGYVQYDIRAMKFSKNLASDLYFCPSYTGDWESYFNQEKSAIYAKFKVDRDEDKYIYATADHEFGHILFGKIIASRINYEIDIDLYKQEEKKIAREIREIWKNDNPGSKVYDMPKVLSEYGSKNDAEFLAESFSSMVGGKPSSVAKAMEKWLKNNYQKGGNENE